MVATAPSPLPTLGAAPPPPTGWTPPPYGGSAPSPPRRRSLGRTAIVIVVLIVVVILVLGAISYFAAPSSSPIVITGVNIYSPDDVCGLDGATADGFNASTSSSVELTYGISGNNTTGGGTAACTIHSVNTTTPGFSVTGANVPLVIPANATPNLSFTVNTPGSPYTGVLTLVMT